MKMKEMHAEKVKKVYTYTAEHAEEAFARLGIEVNVRDKRDALDLVRELDISGLRKVK
jgi:hypothetical protein